MKNEYSDSWIPYLGIGTSFLVLLVGLLGTGALVGLFLQQAGFRGEALGGVFLLIIFLIMMAGPLVFNRIPSRFERSRKVLERCDGLGTIQGLRGAMFRLVLYEDGFEIRAFFHRYFIPFNRIKNATFIPGRFSDQLNLETGLPGFPNYVFASGDQFRACAKSIASPKSLPQP